jgi:putative salt-induced outer membrane protein
MKKQSMATAAALAALAFASTAQAEVADGKWRGVAGASLAVTSGNSSNQALLVNADVARLTSQDKISLAGFINEGKSKVKGASTTTAGKWGVGGQYDYNLTPDVFAFGKLGLDHDRVTDLSLRTLLGAGLGYHVIRTKADTFDVFGGVSYANTAYKNDKTIGGTTAKTFSSTGLLLGEESSHQVNDSVFLKQRLEYYPGLTGEKAQLLKLTGSVSVAMSKTMALTVGVINTYNSQVATGQKKNDLAVFTGVSMKLGD